MKAIRIKRTGPLEVLEYEEVPTPSPRGNQVLVKVESASVNYADVMLRKGTYPHMPPLPAVPGIDCSGVVESVGDAVARIRPGQRVAVLGPGCYAEYVAADAAGVFPLPEGVDMDEAAAIPVNYLTAWHMMHTMAGIRAGGTILLYAAAGGVGTAVIQLARLSHVRVIGLTSSGEKAEYARSHGIDHIIEYTSEDVAQRVKSITGGRGVDVVLNSVAGDTFERDFQILAPLGQIIWFGMAAGPPKENLTALLGSHFTGSTGIRSFLLYSVYEYDPQLMASSFGTLLRYLQEKKIRPHIHRRFPLSQAARAHELLESRTVTGKLILKPGDF